MNATLWQQTTLSPCGTFHLLENRPLYTHRFKRIMKYHAPGLAPVEDVSGAFHIDIEGQEAYSQRFIETFGFYEGLAAVNSQEGWLHIHPSGIACYSERYLWCGNFQEGYCTVKTKQGSYCHINSQGQKAYPGEYAYVGDFKEGLAVVCNRAGLHTHIDYQGKFVHGHWFLNLDIFHKGFARAQDRQGWYHINRSGLPLYTQRYVQVEPFYNGIALVETYSGALITLDTQGKLIAELRPPTQPSWQQLSAEMVGFWNTETIASAVRLRVLEDLPSTTTDISQQTGLTANHLERLLRALWELGIVYPQEERWQLTEKGHLLAPARENFLASAAVMWSDVNRNCWHALDRILMSHTSPLSPLFKMTATDEKQAHYHQAIDGYALEDFSPLLSLIDWQHHQSLIGVGRSATVILKQLLQQYPHLQARLLGDAYIFKHLKIHSSITDRYALQPHSPSHAWPASADAILLPRFLHYWPDQEALTILQHASSALLPGGKIYLLETVLEVQTPQGSLLDLNMLVESGGQLRTLSAWQQLFKKSHLCLQTNQVVSPDLNVLTLQHDAIEGG